MQVSDLTRPWRHQKSVVSGQAGFTQSEGKGSHTKWIHPSGSWVTVPTGYRTISPGVVRQVNKAIQQCQGE